MSQNSIELASANPDARHASSSTSSSTQAPSSAPDHRRHSSRQQSSQSLDTNRATDSTTTSDNPQQEQHSPAQDAGGPAPSITQSVISRWSEINKPFLFDSLKKDILALAGVIIAVYFGWKTIALANKQLLVDFIQICQNNQENNLPLTQKCQDALASSDSLIKTGKLVQRGLDQQGFTRNVSRAATAFQTDESMAAWPVLRLVATFTVGIFTGVFFRPRMEPFRPVVSWARRGLSSSDEVQRVVKTWEERAFSKTTHRGVQAPEEMSDDSFHYNVRERLLNHRIGPLSKDFICLVKVKFMYLLLEKVRQLERHAEPRTKVDECLKHIRTSCAEGIENEAQLYDSEKSLARALMELMQHGYGSFARGAGDKTPHEGLYRALQALGQLEGWSTSKDDMKHGHHHHDSPIEAQEANKEYSHLTHMVRQQYQNDARELSRNHGGKADYDLASVSKNKSPYPSPPSSRTPSPKPLDLSSPEREMLQSRSSSQDSTEEQSPIRSADSTMQPITPSTNSIFSTT